MANHRIIVVSFLLLNLDLTTAMSHMVTASLNGKLSAPANTDGSKSSPNLLVQLPTTIQLATQVGNDNTVKKPWSTPNNLNTLETKVGSKGGQKTLNSAQPPINILTNAVAPRPETKASNGYIVEGPPSSNFKTYTPPGSNLIIAVPVDRQVNPVVSGPQSGTAGLPNPTIATNPVVSGPQVGTPGVQNPTIPTNPIASGPQDGTSGVPNPTIPDNPIVSSPKDGSPGSPNPTIPTNPIGSGPQGGSPGTQSVIPETKPSLIQTKTPSGQSEPTGPVGPRIIIAKESPFQKVPGSELIVVKTNTAERLPTIVVDTAPGQNPGVVVPGSSIIVAKLPEAPTTKPPIVITTPAVPGVCLNGLGYVSHPSECTKFYQCEKKASGSVTATEFQCPYGLFWNSRVLSCDYPRNVLCDNHPCTKTNSRYAPMTNKCNGFWLCKTGRAPRALCCARGASFSNKRQRCVRNKKCRVKCRRVNRGGDSDDSDDSDEDDDDDDDDDDDSSESNESEESNEIAECDKRVAPDDDRFYEHKVPGNKWTRMPCPLTTAFDDNTCACTKIILKRPSGKRPSFLSPANRCEPELYLSFTGGIRDISKNRHYIENKGVVVKNGLAVFNGRSKLEVNRFANSPLGRNLEIELMYTPFNRNRKQVLISNGDRGVTPSVYISMGSSAKTPYITFKLRTIRPRRIKTIKLPVVSKSGPIHVKLTLKNGVFTGTVDGQSRSQNGFGEIAVAKSSLVIGSSTRKNKFKGYLNYVKMYFCDSQEK